ncbi:MAG: DinB family protein [Candidatus Limnocylindria bacterium]
MTRIPFASPEIAQFWRYMSGSLDRLVELAASLDDEALSWRPPAEETNSIGALTVHTLGNAEENILEILAGHAVHRDRDSEFAGGSMAPHELVERWQILRPQLEAALAALPAAELDRAREHARRGAIFGREALIITGRHAAEHLGQAELTRDLWMASKLGRA